MKITLTNNALQPWLEFQASKLEAVRLPSLGFVCDLLNFASIIMFSTHFYLPHGPLKQQVELNGTLLKGQAKVKGLNDWGQTDL